MRTDTYKELQLGTEKTFYETVKIVAASAKTAATAEASTNGTITYAAAGTDRATLLSYMGLTNNETPEADTAFKVMTDAATARDNSAKPVAAAVGPPAVAEVIAGSGWRLPNARTVSGWESTWALSAANINTWWGTNDTNVKGGTSDNVLYAWWLKAAAYHAAVADWHVFWGGDDGNGTVTDANKGTAMLTTGVTFGANVLNSPGNGDNAWGCDLTSFAAVVTPSSHADISTDDAAGCKEYCERVSMEGIYTTLGADYSSQIYPVTSASLQYCHAYNVKDTGTQSCRILISTSTSQADATAAGADPTGGPWTCKNVTGNFGADAFYAKAKAVKDAKDDAALGTTRTAVDTDMDGLAALEKTWATAYFVVEYWKVVETELTVTTDPSKAKTYSDMFTTLDGNANTAGSIAETTATKNTADSSLTTSTSALATLEAAVSTVQA